MSHPRDDLTALLDGALPPARAAAVEAHLAGCPDCRAERERLRGALAALEALPPAPALPPFFSARLEARLRDERGRPRGLRAVLAGAHRGGGRRVLAWAGAAALAVVAGLPAGLWLRDRAETRAMVEELELLQDWETASAVAVDTPEDLMIVARLDELERGEALP